MSETPEGEEATQAAPEAPSGPEYCRWCGAKHEPTEDADWLCPECERYQDAMICPTCGQLASITALGDNAPPPVAPKTEGSQ